MTIVEVEKILERHNNIVSSEVVKEVMVQNGGVLSSSKMHRFGLFQSAILMLRSKELIYGRCDEGNYHFGLPEQKGNGNTEIGWIKELILLREEYDFQKHQEILRNRSV